MLSNLTRADRRKGWWSKRSGAQQTAIISAVIVAGGSVTAAVLPLVFRQSPSSSNPTPSASLHSISPSAPSSRSRPTPRVLSASINLKPRSLVPECAAISGTVATGISGSKQLWLFAQIPNQANHPSNTFYLLHQLKPNSQRIWSASISLGSPGEDGRPYWLEVISSDPSLTGPVNVKDLSEGALSGLPPNFDQRPLVKMEVVRGVSNSSAGKCHSYTTTINIH
jgi:hypothetical protein